MEEVDAVLQKKNFNRLQSSNCNRSGRSGSHTDSSCRRAYYLSGEWIHIVGDNGSGKSTFVKLIANQLGMGCHVDGQVRRSSELERPFPYVRQNPEAAIIGTTAWEDLLIGLEQAGVDAEQIQPRIAAALETVRLLDRQHQPVSTMSGGQKQLVAIAGCLAADAPLLILDEAASMLDTASRELVLRAVREQHRRGMTVIWVTHSMEGRQPQDRLIVFDKGRITHDGTIAEDAELHCGRQLTVDAVNVNALSSKTNPEHYLGESQPTGNKRMERDRGPEGALAEGWKLESVSIRRDASHGKPLLNIPRLQIPTGGLTLIAGSNGAGKTTLLETIAGLRRPSAGDISLGGEPLWNGRKLNREVLLKFGLSLQHSESQWFLPQVKDEIVYSLRPYSLGPDDQEARTTSAMELAGLGIDMAARNPWSLSGGQQRRLAWACLLAAQPAWLLLDEPTAGLDAKGTADLLYGLSRHVEQGGSAIVVTHDIGLFRELADRILLVQDGELTASFSAEEWFEDGRIPASNWLLDEQASLKQVQQRREPAGERQNHSSRSPEQSPQPGNQERKGLQWSGYDPRALWLSYVLLAAGILLQHDWQGMIVSGLITIAALWSGKADLRPWFRLIGLYVFMFIFFFVFFPDSACIRQDLILMLRARLCFTFASCLWSCCLVWGWLRPSLHSGCSVHWSRQSGRWSG